MEHEIRQTGGRWLAAVVFGACLGWSISGLAADISPEAVLNSATSAIAADQAGLERGKTWNRKQDALLEKLRHANLEFAWYDRQRETFQRYVKTAEARVAKQEEAIVELRRMERLLEGEMVRIADAFSEGVKQDIPFLEQERSDRVHFIQKSVADYDLARPEKLRRVLEALQAELSYSTGVEWGPGAITQGESRQGVVFVRAGRVGYYALALDGSKAWHWQRGAGFTPMEEEDRVSLENAVAMLKTGQFDSLPVLPVLEVE